MSIVGLALGEEIGEAVLAVLEDLVDFEATGDLVGLGSVLADLTDLDAFESWAETSGMLSMKSISNTSDSRATAEFAKMPAITKTRLVNFMAQQFDKQNVFYTGDWRTIPRMTYCILTSNLLIADDRNKKKFYAIQKGAFFSLLWTL